MQYSHIEKYGLLLRAYSQKFRLVVLALVNPKLSARAISKLDFPLFGAPDRAPTDSANFRRISGYHTAITQIFQDAADVSFINTVADASKWLCFGFGGRATWSQCHRHTSSSWRWTTPIPATWMSRQRGRLKRSSHCFAPEAKGRSGKLTPSCKFEVDMSKKI